MCGGGRRRRSVAHAAERTAQLDEEKALKVARIGDGRCS
jgi:hypothetical protein